MISLNRLRNYKRIGAHPNRINTIQIILKHITNVHRRTYKGHKIIILHSTHSSKQVRTLVDDNQHVRADGSIHLGSKYFEGFYSRVSLEHALIN